MQNSMTASQKQMPSWSQSYIDTSPCPYLEHFWIYIALPEIEKAIFQQLEMFYVLVPLVLDLLLTCHTTNPSKTLFPASEPSQNILCHRYSQYLEISEVFSYRRAKQTQAITPGITKDPRVWITQERGREWREQLTDRAQDQTSSVTPLTSHPKTGSDVPSAKKLQHSKGWAGKPAKAPAFPQKAAINPSTWQETLHCWYWKLQLILTQQTTRPTGLNGTCQKEFCSQLN